jgi:Lysozyme like domain
MPVKAGYLLLAGSGGAFVWSGLKGKSISSVFRQLAGGDSPTAASNANPISGVSAPSGTSGSTAVSGSTATNLTGVPSGQGVYSQAGVAQLWTANGGPADTAAFAAKVAMAESGGSATVTSANPDGGTNVGIFQLDTKGVGAGYTVAQLQNANLNTRITIAATNGGVDWEEWGDPVTAAVGYHYTPGT